MRFAEPCLSHLNLPKKVKKIAEGDGLSSVNSDFFFQLFAEGEKNA